MRIVHKRFCDWDRRMRQRLLDCTMQTSFVRSYYSKIAPESPTIVALNNSQVMGWVFIYQRDGENDTNMKVHKRYLRRGLGRKLLVEAIEHYGPVVVGGGNDASDIFFQKMVRRHPNQVEVLDWWSLAWIYENRLKRILESV